MTALPLQLPWGRPQLSRGAGVDVVLVPGRIAWSRADRSSDRARVQAGAEEHCDCRRSYGCEPARFSEEITTRLVLGGKLLRLRGRMNMIFHDGRPFMQLAIWNVDVSFTASNSPEVLLSDA